MLLQTYHFYGLSIRSQWPLPCLKQEEPGLPEVKLLAGSASSFENVYLETKKQANPSAFFHYARLQDGTTYIRWSGLFEFLISYDGRSIIGHPLKNGSKEAFLSNLLGQTLSFAMVQQGIEPLHSTVVMVNDGAVGFMGDCGHGKSSLGASFLQAGYRLLTDDLLVLKENHGSFMASPGFPRIKLFPKIAKKLIGKKVNGIPMNNRTSKLIFPLDRHQFARTPVPLRSIYVLTPPAAGLRPKKVSIRTLSQLTAFLSLLKNTFNTKVTDPERLKQQFSLATRLSTRVPIKSLSYPRNISFLPKVVEAIKLDLFHQNPQ